MKNPGNIKERKEQRQSESREDDGGFKGGPPRFSTVESNLRTAAHKALPLKNGLTQTWFEFYSSLTLSQNESAVVMIQSCLGRKSFPTPLNPGPCQ